jgi:hypothetical protein
LGRRRGDVLRHIVIENVCHVAGRAALSGVANLLQKGLP